MQNILVILRSSAFLDSKAREAQDMAMALAAIELPVDLLYLGEAVLQLLPLTGTTACKDFTVAQKLFPLYDIGNIYVCAKALQQYHIEPTALRLPVIIVDDAGLAVQQQAQQILVF